MIPQFKIYDKKTKRFIIDYTLEINRHGVTVLDEHNDLLDIKHLIFLPYIGLNDENNKPIFESDLIKVHHPKYNYEYIAEVKSMLKDSCPGYDLTAPDTHFYDCNVFSHELTTGGLLYSIGNIYDNKGE